MSRLGINTGSNPNDGQGDPLRVAMGKINSNFQEIYNTFGDGFTLASYASTAGVSTLAQNLTGSPRINVSGILNTGITTTEHLEVRNVTSTGIITAVQFVGDGSQLENVVATSSGVEVLDENVRKGIAKELNFGQGLFCSGPDGVGRVTIAVTTSVVSGGGTGGTPLEIRNQNAILGEYSKLNFGSNLFASVNPVTGVVTVTTTPGGINISGVSTFSGLNVVGGSVLDNLNVTGLSTFAGITTVTGATLFAKQVRLTGSVFGLSFVKTGGTSSQFLKADGTVDSNTYLTSFTETDPVFNASPAKNITNTQISNWNTAYSWGNHATAGYTTAGGVASTITSVQINNWDTSYSWGNHAVVGYATQGYVTNSLIGYATQSYVNNALVGYATQGYVNNALVGYATQGYVNSLTLNQLADVNVGAPSTGQVLKWSGTEWEAASDLTAAGGTGIGLSDLSVTINAAGINSLTYNNNTGVFLFTPTSLVGYATEGYVTNSLVGYATQGYVNNALVGYATQGYVNTQIGLNTFTGAASTITSGQISNWNTAYSWGNHATAGYNTTGYVPIAGYSTSAGIATVAQGLTGTPSINVYNVGVASAINVAAASTFQQSVHFESTLLIGDVNELQIFHDGNNSYIDNASAGNLIIRDSGTGIQLKKTSGALMGVFNNDAGVELYYDGVLKFQTFQNGVAINESVGIGSTAGNPPYRLTVSGVGATITQGLANAIADFTSSVNGYGQVNVRNSLSGTNASGDVVITANTGTDISNFIDLGINNTGFTTSSWTINGALDGYLYTSDGNLSIGAAATNKYLSLFAGGTLAANEQVRITTTGVGIGTTLASSKLTVTGDARISGVVTATSFSGSGTNLTGIITTLVAGTNVTITQSSGIATINATAGGGGSSQWTTVASGIITTTNVGIATTNATSVLTVVGDGSFTGVVTATRFESSSAGTPTIDSPNNLNINAVTVAISTDVTVGRDIYAGINTSTGLILRSPNGSKYRLIVDNSGNLSTILVP